MIDLSAVETRLALLKRGIRFLMKLGQAERALILSGSEADERPTVEAVYGFEPQEAAEQTLVKRIVFKAVLREGKAILCNDARQDRRFSVREGVTAGLVSVLTLPFYDRNNRIVGLLYVDGRKKAGAFDYSHLKVAEEFAHAFGLRWCELPAEGAQASAPPRPQVEIPDFSLARSSGSSQNWWVWSTLVTALVFVSLTLLALFGGQPQVEAQTQASAASSGSQLPLEKRPFGQARTFLKLVNQKKFSQAHSLLSEPARERWPAESLAQMSRDWEPGRQVLGETLKVETATTTIGRLGLKEWTWHFVKEGHDWKLDRFHGE